MHEVPTSARTSAAIAWLLGLAAALLIAYATAVHGVGAEHFGVNNIAAAEGLVSGRGLSNLRSDPFVYWGPSFPALLALGRSAGFDFLDVARWLTILSVLVFVALHARLLIDAAASRSIAVVATVLLVVSPQFLPIESSLRSQPFFLALMLATAVSLARWLELRATRWPWTTALLCVAASLHRYEGLLLAVAAALVVLVRSTGEDRRRAGDESGRRLATAAFLCGVPALALAAWFLRNQVVSGTLTGVRKTPLIPAGEQLADGWSTLCLWLVSWSGSERVRSAVVAALAVFVLAAITLRLARARRGEGSRSSRDALYVYGAFPLVYGGGLVALALSIDMDKIGERILFPLLPFVLGFVLIAVDEWAEFLRARAPRLRALPLAAAALFVALDLSVCVPVSAHEVSRMRREGAGGIAGPAFSGSELAAWLREHPLEGPLHSNHPEFVLLFANRSAYEIPEQEALVWKLVELQIRPTYWIWLERSDEARRLLAELRARSIGELVAEFPEGVVLHFP